LHLAIANFKYFALFYYLLFVCCFFIQAMVILTARLLIPVNKSKKSDILTCRIFYFSLIAALKRAKANLLILFFALNSCAIT